MCAKTGRDEGDETIIVAASEAADGTGRVTGTATIKDDDGAPSLSIDSPSVTEGDSGSKNLTFTVTLDKAGTRQVTLDWAEGDGRHGHVRDGLRGDHRRHADLCGGGRPARPSTCR